MNSGRVHRWTSLAVPAALAFGLCATGAWVRMPWHDEYFTAWAAGLPWSDLLAALRLDSGPPLLYALTRLGVLLGLPALPVARAIAVLSGAGAAALVAATARERRGEGAAWAGGLLLACHPLAVHWGSEARAYGLLLLATAWGGYELARLQRGLSGAWRLAAAVALACWSHVLGLLAALAFATACTILPPPGRRRGLGAVAVGLASHLPWLPITLAQPPAAIAWMAHLWEQLPIPRSPALALARYLSPVAAFGGVLDLPSPPLGVELVGALLLFIPLGLAFRRPAEIALPAVAFGVGVAAFAALLLAAVPVFYPGRAHVLLLTSLVLVLASPPAPAARAAVAALASGGLAVAVWAIGTWSAAPPPPEASLARHVRAALPDGGTLVVGGIWRLGLEYHLGPARTRVALVSVPAAAARHPGWYVDGHDRLEPGELEALEARLAASPGTAAVLVAPAATTAPELLRLAARLGLRPAAEVPGGILFLPPRHASTGAP